MFDTNTMFQAIAIVNLDAMMASMWMLPLLISMLGVVGAMWFVHLDELTQEVGHNYWGRMAEMAEKPVFVVPEYMEDWPTLEEIQEQEAWWQAEVLQTVFEEWVNSYQDEITEEDDEQELDELWGRLYPSTSNTIMSYMLRQ